MAHAPDRTGHPHGTARRSPTATRTGLGLEPPTLNLPPDSAAAGDAVLTQREARELLGLRPEHMRRALVSGVLEGVPGGRQELVTIGSALKCQTDPSRLEPVLDEDLLTPRQAAELLGLRPQALPALESQQLLRPEQMIGGKPRYRRRQVRQLRDASPHLLRVLRGEAAPEPPPAPAGGDAAPPQEPAHRPRIFALDRFQIEAEELLVAGHHVLVSAPTGAGKSLIAERLVERVVEAGQGMIYTGPIKALINQKFRDLARLYGDRVGIITGDVVIRDDAPILVVTTEIFRNMAVGRPHALAAYSCLVLDEVHYLDSDRGAAWEESIIFAPPHMQILALSATVANSAEIAAWMAEVTGRKTHVVHEAQRPVPLAVHYVDPSARITQFERAVAEWAVRGKGPRGRQRPSHWRVVSAVAQRGWLPCLYFVFSRTGCEEKARDLSLEMDFLHAAERQRVEDWMARRETDDMAHSPSYRLLRTCLVRGVAFHHAGMLPQAKELVEELYERGLVKVLYCTETFAVGVNFPVKCACFEGVRKFGGDDFRPLSNLEFHQMAGRAGRRGIDREGHAVVVLGAHDLDGLRDFSSADLEPVISRLQLRPNTVLNLVATRGDPEIRTLLTRSLKVFQAEHGGKAQAESARVKVDWLRERMCPQAPGTLACPVLRRPLEQEAHSLQGQLRGLADARTPRALRMRRKLEDELKAVSARLGADPAAECTQQQMQNCRSLYPQFDRAVAELKKAEKRERRGARAAAELLGQFDRIRAELERLGYLEGDALLPRGLFAREVHVEEIAVTELYFSGFFHQAQEIEVCALLTGLAYDGKEGESTLPRSPGDALKGALNVVRRHAGNFHAGIFFPALRWAAGREFAALLDEHPVPEGDLVSAFRRCMDLLRQVRRAVEEPAIREKLARCLERMDRPPVRVELE